MKPYSTKANARRAARTQITDVEKPVEGTDFTIEPMEDGKFSWRRVQVAPKAPAPEAQAEQVPAPKAKPTPEQLFTAQRAPTLKECIEHGHKVKQAVFDKETAPKAEGLTGEAKEHLMAKPTKETDWDNMSPEQAAKYHSIDRTVVHKEPRRKGAVREVWDICEENKGLARKDVIAICVGKGINFYTARTQYQAWKQATDNSKPAN